MDDFFRRLLLILSTILLGVVSPTAVALPTGTPSPHAGGDIGSPESSVRSTPKPRSVSVWHTSEVSWYGKDFYGNGTACGQTYNATILGVAHKSFKCGTKVEFTYRGRSIVVRVIDRGPYVRGRDWDLSRGLCKALRHCFTGDIKWRLVK